MQLGRLGVPQHFNAYRLQLNTICLLPAAGSWPMPKSIYVRYLLSKTIPPDSVFLTR